MAPVKKPSAAKKPPPAPAGAARSRWQLGRLWALRFLAGLAALYAALIATFAVLPPPINLYQIAEAWRLGGIDKDWVGWEDIAPDMARAVVAAEDANFCLHWGFDMAAIREAIESGGDRGASTLSQQMVKNTFLWHGRNWLRKAMEAALTPVVELLWSKQRILEMYLNQAEFAEGVFGVQAAAQHYWGIDARDLSPTQAARLAAALPDPKDYNAGSPGPYVRNRARQIMSGAETIKADGRADCFEATD